MDTKVIELDFSQVRSTRALHELLSKTFGFPAFYGANANALIDCLSSLRLPEDQMTGWTLAPLEVLVIHVRNLFSAPREVWNDFLVAMGAVNAKCDQMGQPPMICLMLRGT
jgi:RNAse (barnase) inhibitor barstar